MPAAEQAIAKINTQARFWFRAQKCGNIGSPCLDKLITPTQGATPKCGSPWWRRAKKCEKG